MIRKIFNWIFKSQLLELENKVKELDKNLEQVEFAKSRFENIFRNLDVTVDHHLHSSSWAVARKFAAEQFRAGNFVSLLNFKRIPLPI